MTIQAPSPFRRAADALLSRIARKRYERLIARITNPAKKPLIHDAFEGKVEGASFDRAAVRQHGYSGREKLLLIKLAKERFAEADGIARNISHIPLSQRPRLDIAGPPGTG